MLQNIDVNGDGEIDLWELCRFLVARHDQILGEVDDAWALEQAFDLLEVDEKGCVRVGELRRLVCMQDNGTLQGVSDDAFNELLMELGVTAGEVGSTRAPLACNNQATEGTGGAVEDSGTGAAGDSARTSSSPLQGKRSKATVDDMALVPLTALKSHPAFAPKAPELVNRSHL